MIQVCWWLNIPLSEIKFTYTSSSGPGGQHVNRASTKAVLRWSLTDSPSVRENKRELLTAKLQNKLTKSGEIIVTSDRFRDRTQNKSDCIFKFKALLIKATKVDKPRKASKVSKSQKKKRLEGKRMQSDKKQSRKRIDH